MSGPSTAARMSASVISVGRAGEHVAAADAALRAHEARALHREQDLLEVGLGEAGALGDLLHRRGLVGAVQREREQRARRVVAPGRTFMLGSLLASPDARVHVAMVARGRCATVVPRVLDSLAWWRPVQARLLGART